MRFALLLSLLLLLCAAVVLSQELPAGEAPSKESSSVGVDNPEEPYSSDNPERPPEDSNSIASNSAGDEDESSSGEHFCIDLALECPDGTYATQDSDCNFICGGAPTGNLNWDYVDNVRAEFQAAYHPINIYVGDMQGKSVVVHPPEKQTDLCLEVSISMEDTKIYPTVYNRVRVFYTKVSDTPMCSPQLCPDGSVVGCDDICPPATAESSSLFMPFVLVFSVVILSACCCCIRRRRCKAQCKASPANVPQVVPSNAYPAEYYELLQQEQALTQSLEGTEMPPYMMAQPMIFPPMPHIPPHMLQTGSFPVMIQAPNGVWYMAPPHPEDA